MRPLGTAPPFSGDGYRHQPAAYEAPASAVAAAALLEEHFGPVVLLLRYGDRDELLAALGRVEGQLTGSVHAQPDDDAELLGLLTRPARRARRPPRLRRLPDRRRGHPRHAPRRPVPGDVGAGHTSVGMTAIRRFLRPVAWQNAPASVLPPELRDENPLGIWRRVDGELTRAALSAPPA